MFGSDEYDWHDERVGLWTQLEEKPDRVLVRRTGTYVRGSLVGAAFLLAVAVTFLEGARRGQGLAQIISILVAALILSRVPSMWRKYRQYCANNLAVELIDSSRSGLTGDAASSAHQAANDDPICIQSRDIAEIEVRENAGRRVGDGALWQIYLRLHGIARRQLIYQTYRWRKQRILAVAQRLGDRWRVPVREVI